MKTINKSELVITLNWKVQTTTLNITPDNKHENNMLSIEIDPVEILIPSTQTHNNLNNMVNEESIHRISSRNKKSSHYDDERFFLVASNGSRSKKIPTTHLNNNTPNYLDINLC